MAKGVVLLRVLSAIVLLFSVAFVCLRFYSPGFAAVRSVACPNNSQRVLTEKTLEQKQDDLFRYLSSPTYMCRAIQRLGKWGDGGWNVCRDKQFVPKKGQCLVYSFGISDDFSFDDAVADNFQCEVHSFDPSMKKQDHKHAERVWFHNLGVWDKDEIKDNGWRMKTVGSIKKMLKHEERLLDVYKMDVEGAEMKTIPNMIKTGEFRKIRQFCFEIHFKYSSTNVISRVYQILRSLEQEGLRLYHSHFNPACGKQSPTVTISKTQCVELCYVNFTLKTEKGALSLGQDIF